MQSLSANFPSSIVDAMNAGASQKTRASTFLLIFSRVASPTSVSLGFTLKHTIPSDWGLRFSRTGLSPMYVSAWAASSIPFATALRNAAIPKTWTDIQTFNARKERLTWSPRFVKFGWFAPHTVS